MKHINDTRRHVHDHCNVIIEARLEVTDLSVQVLDDLLRGEPELGSRIVTNVIQPFLESSGHVTVCPVPALYHCLNTFDVLQDEFNILSIHVLKDVPGTRGSSTQPQDMALDFFSNELLVELSKVVVAHATKESASGNLKLAINHLYVNQATNLVALCGRTRHSFNQGTPNGVAPS